MGKREKEPIDLFQHLSMKAAERRAEAHQAWLQAMSPTQRAEYRGAIMAAGQIYRCLGDRAEHFGDQKLMQRIQEKLHDAIRNGAPQPSPRPFVTAWQSLHSLKVHETKRMSQICRLRPQPQPQRTANELQLTLEIQSHVFHESPNLSHFQFVLGAGLLSDMHYNDAIADYQYQHPTLQGQFQGTESPVLPINTPTTINLRLQLPLPDGGLPPGLHLLCSLGLWFWRNEQDGPFFTKTGIELWVM